MPMSAAAVTMLTALLTVLTVLVTVASAPVDALPTLNYEIKQTYCGAHIANTLQMFCKGRYLSMMDIVIKRTHLDGSADGDADVDADADGDNFDSNDEDAEYYLNEAIAMEKARLERNYGAVVLLQQLRRTRREQRQFKRQQKQHRPRRTNEMHYVYRGIADECCLKPCSVRTLLSYCRVPPKY